MPTMSVPRFDFEPEEINSHMFIDRLTKLGRTLEYVLLHLDPANVEKIDAASVAINDTGGYYTSTHVEGALQEVGNKFAVLTASSVAINDTGGYYTSTHVEGALQEVGNRLYGYLAVSATTGSGNSTYDVSAPFIGRRMVIYCNAANSSDKAIAYSGSTATFFGPGAALRINFTETGQAVDLAGVSTARWAVLSMGSTIVTSALPSLTT